MLKKRKKRGHLHNSKSRIPTAPYLFFALCSCSLRKSRTITGTFIGSPPPSQAKPNSHRRSEFNLSPATLSQSPLLSPPADYYRTTFTTTRQPPSPPYLQPKPSDHHLTYDP
ncbi:hypothetical protein Hanom_Chr03g00229601 [Helianthus anomalus]